LKYCAKKRRCLDRILDANDVIATDPPSCHTASSSFSTLLNYGRCAPPNKTTTFGKNVNTFNFALLPSDVLMSQKKLSKSQFCHNHGIAVKKEYYF